MNKKGYMIVAIAIVIVIAVVGIVFAVTNRDMNKTENEKVEVIATLFPQYDFTKRIGGDKVNVSLLLPSGVESHTYEPTPQDMIKINQADVFAYTGENMEPWAATIASSISSDTVVLDTTKNINLINVEEFEETHSEHDHAEEGHTHEEGEEHTHDHDYDPHIWLNPMYAIEMVYNIKDTLVELDPENKEYYEENTKNYVEELRNLDSQIKETVANGTRNEIVFGGPFAYAYFIERYDLDFESVYDSCSSETEPSVSKVKEVIEHIAQNNIPVVFYQEMSSGNIANTIAESTNAKPLVMHSIHNASTEEIQEGASYISLMTNNMNNLKEALN